jgi:hypothetical protein
MYGNMNNIIKPIAAFSAVVLGTAIVHWMLIQTYATTCSSPTIWGAFTSLFTLGSPFCQFINYTQFEISKHYISIWGAAAISLAAYVMGKLTISDKNNK